MNVMERNQKPSKDDLISEELKKLKDRGRSPFFNCHTHVFNLYHVHDGFLKGMIPLGIRITILVLVGSLITLVWFTTNDLILRIAAIVILFLFPVFPLLIISLGTIRLRKLLKVGWIRMLTKMLRKLIPGEDDFLERYANFILHSYDTLDGDIKSQEEIFNKLKSYYPESTRFVALSMDMAYMVNCNKKGKVKEPLEIQYKKLSALQQKNPHTLYPFIHADPRRVASDPNYIQSLKHYLTGEREQKPTFFGIKIYPALGYFPFDRRLKPVYDLALEYNLPIMTHCSVGPVYYRGKVNTLKNEGYFEEGQFIHPFTGNELEGKKPKVFSPHFTHPLNYYCLMHESDKLFNYWQKCETLNSPYIPDHLKEVYTADDLVPYKNLKICLGHYGGTDEWKYYLNNAWLPSKENALAMDNKRNHLKGGKWVYQEDGFKTKNLLPHSWHSIISEMLQFKDDSGQLVFPNLFADISYNLSDEEIHPLLKVRLQGNEEIARKTLFGTDFYMVSMKASERAATMRLRSFIGEAHFEQIALNNPLNYLSSRITTPDQLCFINKNL